MGHLTEHQLLVFWTQLFVLVAVARALGGLMRRFGQPPVVGELAAGLLLGPSILGRVAPGAFDWLFPSGDPMQAGALLAVSWLGVALLLVVTGFETDLALLTSLGRSSFLVSAGSLVVPLVIGFGLGLVLPETLLGNADMRVAFAMFMAVALSISALPVVAKILIDMDLMRRNLGQITVAAGMANDLVGWILLGVIAGVVTSGGFAAGALAVTVVAISAFLAVMLTVGQRLVDAALRRARPHGVVSTFTVLIVVTLAAGVITQAIGVEAVLGAFVAGIVLGRSRYQQAEVRHSLETVVHGFVAPIFFATAGLSVDLGLLFEPSTALAAGAVLAVAALTKLLGSYAGARLGGLNGREGLAIGIGLNARGAMEIVVATIGLSLGVLNAASYTVIVVLAMATSMMAPPLLRRILSRLEAGPEEARRLEREAMLEASVIAGTGVALLPTRGGINSRIAARVLDLALQPDTSVRVLTVREDDSAAVRARCDLAAAEISTVLAERDVERVDRASTNAAEAILAEAELGYGVIALGATERFESGDELSPILRDLLVASPLPMLLVRHAAAWVGDAGALTFRHVIVSAAGTRDSQAAQEIAFTLGEKLAAQVDVVYVDTSQAPGDREGLASRIPFLGPRRLPSEVVDAPGQPVAEVMLSKARHLAEQFGSEVNVLTRVGAQAGPELVAVAAEQEADLIVISGRVRSHDGQAFLGHGVEHVLRKAPQTVLALVFPPGN